VHAAGSSLVVQLAGGLGNQLFQYAFGRSLALETGRRLLLDRMSGFVADRTYRRSYALGRLPIAGHDAGFTRSTCFFAAKAFRRRAALANAIAVVDCPWGRHLIEMRQEPHPRLADLLTSPTVWCEGYWQSPASFDRHADVIAREIQPAGPADSHVRDLGRQAAECESVAIGVRLFEECPSPQGGVAGEEFYGPAIEAIRERVRNPVFFLFSTDRDQAARLLPDGLRWHDATASGGVVDAMDAYWLMSRCRHHVISQSTLYWWSAWVASQRGEDRGCVVAHDAFTNPACLPDAWKRLVPTGSSGSSRPTPRT
jgi:hypothetical protein